MVLPQAADNTKNVAHTKSNTANFVRHMCDGNNANANNATGVAHTKSNTVNFAWHL